MRHSTTGELKRIVEMRNAGATIQSIADALGRSRQTISIMIRYHDLKCTTNRRLTYEDHMLVVGMVHSGMPVSRVAKMLGRCPKTIRRHLEYYERGEHRREEEP